MLKQWRRILRLVGYSQTVRAAITDELPDKPSEGVLYLIGEDSQFWQSALLCPCGCKDLIRLPMDSGGFPNWTASIGAKGLPTLRPSVDRTSGCRSHFVLQDGKVIWYEITKYGYQN